MNMKDWVAIQGAKQNQIKSIKKMWKKKISHLNYTVYNLFTNHSKSHINVKWINQGVIYNCKVGFYRNCIQRHGIHLRSLKCKETTRDSDTSKQKNNNVKKDFGLEFNTIIPQDHELGFIAPSATGSLTVSAGYSGIRTDSSISSTLNTGTLQASVFSPL